MSFDERLRRQQAEIEATAALKMVEARNSEKRAQEQKRLQGEYADKYKATAESTPEAEYFFNLLRNPELEEAIPLVWKFLKPKPDNTEPLPYSDIRELKLDPMTVSKNLLLKKPAIPETQDPQELANAISALPEEIKKSKAVIGIELVITKRGLYKCRKILTSWNDSGTVADTHEEVTDEWKTLNLIVKITGNPNAISIEVDAPKEHPWIIARKQFHSLDELLDAFATFIQTGGSSNTFFNFNTGKQTSEFTRRSIGRGAL